MEANGVIKYLKAVRVLRDHLSENMIEIINDALQCYGKHPEDHTYDEELEDIRLLAFAFDWEGYNSVLPEYSILTGWDPLGND